MAANKQDPRYFKYSPFPKRQCAVTGAVDANGAANFMSRSLNTVGFSASASVPLVVTWANGFDPFPVDYAYKWTSTVSGPSGWDGFSNATHYLYIDYDPDTDTVSYGSTTVAPNDDLVAPSHGSGVHWFDQTKYKMYESVASVWTERIRVFVGECVSNGTGVTSVISYALNGRYTGPETALPSVGTQTSWNHYIGTNKLQIRIPIICKNAAIGYSVGEFNSRYEEYNNSTAAVNGLNGDHGRLSMSKTRGTVDTNVFSKVNGVESVVTASDWRYIPIAERSY